MSDSAESENVSLCESGMKLFMLNLLLNLLFYSQKEENPDLY